MQLRLSEKVQLALGPGSFGLECQSKQGCMHGGVSERGSERGSEQGSERGSASPSKAAQQAGLTSALGVACDASGKGQGHAYVHLDMGGRGTKWGDGAMGRAPWRAARGVGCGGVGGEASAVRHPQCLGAA